jgi:hypothetical protein
MVVDPNALIAALAAAIPATVAALRTGTGVKEIRRVKSMLQAHLTDPNAHDPNKNAVRPMRAVKEKERGA